jgi:F-type H+-transporting ATPase subunit b
VALLRVDPGLIIWLWITFGIILLILRLTVWGKITGALDKRSGKIAADLDSARQAGEKATAVLAEYDQKIREGRAEAARIIEASRVEAARLKEDVLRQSQEESRELRERAAREIEKAREDAERALRGQVVSLSFSIADAILKRETGTADNRAFVEEFAEKLSLGAGSTGGGGSSRN